MVEPPGLLAAIAVDETAAARRRRCAAVVASVSMRMTRMPVLRVPGGVPVLRRRGGLRSGGRIRLARRQRRVRGAAIVRVLVPVARP